MSAYVSDIPLRVRGPFDPDAFMASVNDVVARHEILRTTFAAVDGAAVQVVHRERAPQLRRHDLRGGQDPLAAARALAVRLAATPFDLATGPLVGLHVAHLAAGDWAVLLAVHHIVVDGWSLAILLDELRDNYRTRVAGALPDRRPNRFQYADYSVWQHEHVRGERLEAQLGYWRERLRNAPRLTLATDRSGRSSGRTAARASMRSSLPTRSPAAGAGPPGAPDAVHGPARRFRRRAARVELRGQLPAGVPGELHVGWLVLRRSYRDDEPATTLRAALARTS